MFEEGISVLFVMSRLTHFGTIKWVAEEIATESSDITPFGMQFFQQLSQLPWRPEGKSPLWSPAPEAGPLTSISPAGKEAALPPWTSPSSLHYSNQPFGVLQKIRAMPF